jgi:hypothetical protein
MTTIKNLWNWILIFFGFRKKECTLLTETEIPSVNPEPREDYKSKNGKVDMGTVELETEVVVTEADMKALEATGRLEQFEKDYGPKIPISMDAERLVGTPFKQPPTISLSEAINNHKPKRRYNKRKPRAGSMTEKPKVTKEETQVKAEQAVASVKPKKRRNYYKKKSNE